MYLSHETFPWVPGVFALFLPDHESYATVFDMPSNYVLEHGIYASEHYPSPMRHRLVSTWSPIHRSCRGANRRSGSWMGNYKQSCDSATHH